LHQPLPQVELIKLEEGGHYPQEHWHELVVEDLLPFLRRKAVWYGTLDLYA